MYNLHSYVRLDSVAMRALNVMERKTDANKAILCLLFSWSFSNTVEEKAKWIFNKLKGEAVLETKNSVEEDVADLMMLLDLHEFLCLKHPQ
ncbi:DNA mismatch repair protein MSH2 [Camellia lanceoleosa]|uniref:DNA mismatch repair protein MSH2 n=1 Tax=Camellia lanceoleosa TaxID=1840588 RepID=A0ACC0FZW1_9ERIC|nr:DNA mismatch repair protein MSH2 [Camellia lanceoleosa]